MGLPYNLDIIYWQIVGEFPKIPIIILPKKISRINPKFFLLEFWLVKTWANEFMDRLFTVQAAYTQAAE